MKCTSIRFGIILACSLFVSLNTYGQSIGIYLSPSFSSHFLSAIDHDQPDRDSIAKMDRADFRWNAGFGVKLPIDKDWALQTGVELRNYGFLRVWEDLQYLDSIHPDIGRVEDLSNNGIKVADYHYRYTYLSIPLLFHRDISSRKYRHTYQFSIFLGPRFQFLFNEKLDIFLQGFSVEGEFDHELEYTPYNPAEFNVAFSMGGRAQIRLDSDWVLSAQPFLDTQILRSGEDGFVKFNLNQFGLDVGINYEF